MTDEIKIKKETLWKTGVFALAAVIILLLIFGNYNSNNNNETETIKISINADDHILGDKNARITIFEFSDFECPFCGRAFIGAVTELKSSDYFKNGEVNFVYKHFPLTNIHKDAQKAAEASECAGKQNKFWEYHDTLFLNQNSLDSSSLKQYANHLGLNSDEFDSCLDSGEFAAKVQSDLKQGLDAGVRGTPHFVFVNSDGETQTVSGAVPFSELENAIRALM